MRVLPRKWRYRFVAIAAVLLAGWLGSSFAVGYRLTRRSGPIRAEPLPSVTWADASEHRLRTDDGHDIGAWLFSVADSRGAVVLLHGNGDTRHHCLSRARILARSGYTTLAITLRCHGDSSGEINDLGRAAALDVLAAVRFLERNARGEAVVISGESMGAAAAIFAAERLGDRVRAYILECPYRDLRTAVLNRTSFYLPPVLDQIAFRGLLTVSPLLLDDVDGIAPVKRIADIPVDVPILLLAGDKDQRTTVADAQALYDRVSSRCRLIWFPGATHGRLYSQQPALYESSVLSFLVEVESRGRLDR